MEYNIKTARIVSELSNHYMHHHLYQRLCKQKPI